MRRRLNMPKPGTCGNTFESAPPHISNTGISCLVAQSPGVLLRGMITRVRTRTAAISAWIAVALCGCSSLVGACGGTTVKPNKAQVSNGGLREPNAKQRREVAEDERQERRVAELEEPPPEPGAVGVRLVQEEYEGQVGAWKAVYERRFGGTVRAVWGAKGSFVSLEFKAMSGKSSGRAEWFVQSPAANRQLVSPKHLIHPKNELARRLQGLPQPRTGTSYPVLLLAGEALTPGRRVAAVVLLLQSEYQPLMFATAGGFAESLLRGYDLARGISTRTGLQYLGVARGASIYKGTIMHGRLGTLTPTPFSTLREAFTHGLVPLLIGWRHGAAHLSALLSRPIQTLIILEPAQP